MRYLFRGLRRDTAKAVWGYVDAELQSHVYDALAAEGIIVESVEPAPAPRPEEPWDFEGALQNASEISGEIDSALNAESKQVNFDDLSQRYKGKRVWVLDREKMKRRVMKIVDTAMAQGQSQSGEDDKTRERVADALEKMFGDQRNITSEASSATVALEDQIGRLTKVVRQVERAVASISAGGRWGGPGGGYHRTVKRRTLGEEQNKVLMEIFQSNVELQQAARGEQAQGQGQDKPAQPTGADAG